MNFVQTGRRFEIVDIILHVADTVDTIVDPVVVNSVVRVLLLLTLRHPGPDILGRGGHGHVSRHV